MMSKDKSKTVAMMEEIEREQIAKVFVQSWEGFDGDVLLTEAMCHIDNLKLFIKLWFSLGVMAGQTVGSLKDMYLAKQSPTNEAL